MKSKTSIEELITIMSGFVDPAILKMTNDLNNYERRYPNILTNEEISKLEKKEWIRYLRENLWERTAQKQFNKSFDDLNEMEKNETDLYAILEIAKAFEKVAKERETKTEEL